MLREIGPSMCFTSALVGRRYGACSQTTPPEDVWANGSGKTHAHGPLREWVNNSRMKNGGV